MNVCKNLCVLLMWWFLYTVDERKNSPVERPLFAATAVCFWFCTVHFWKPIATALHGNHMKSTSFSFLVWCTLCPITSSAMQSTRAQPRSPSSLRSRTTLYVTKAASGFLWIFWALPSYNANYILLATMWSTFIVALVGALVFEEGGLRGPDGFGKKYEDYRQNVPAFRPHPNFVKKLVRKY